jgi:hypothetical protein
MEIFLFITSFSKKIVLTKKLTLKISSASSSGGQGKLTTFITFPWSPLEAGLSIYTFCFLFNRGRKQLFLIYKQITMR